MICFDHSTLLKYCSRTFDSKTKSAGCFLYWQSIKARPVETVLEQKIYENNWKAKDIDHLVKKMKQKAEELMLQCMIEDVQKKLRSM